MIKYILTVLLLIGGAIALTGYAFINFNQVDKQEAQKVIVLLNNLEQANKELDKLVLKSRYGLDKNYDALVALSKQINTYFSALRFLTNNESEVLKNNPDWQSAIKRYDSINEIRLGAVESFKRHNAVLRNSVGYVPGLGRELERLTAGDDALQILIKKTNQAILNYLADNDQDEAVKAMRQLLPELTRNEFLFPEENAPLFFQYISHVKAISQEHPSTEAYVKQVIGVSVGKSIGALSELLSVLYPAKGKAIKNMMAAFSLYIIVALIIASFLIIKLALGRRGKREQADAEASQLQIEALTVENAHFSERLQFSEVALEVAMRGTRRIRNYMAIYAELFSVLADNEKELRSPAPDRKKLGAGLKKSIKIFSRNKLVNSVDEIQKTLNSLEKNVTEMKQTDVIK